MSRVLVFVLVLIVILGLGIGALWFLSSHSALSVDPVPKVIGAKTPFTLTIKNPYGARRVTVTLSQNDNRAAVHEESAAADRLFFWRRHETPRQVSFVAGRASMPALHDGKAALTVEVQSNDLAGAVDTLAFEVNVITRPPGVVTDSVQHYIHQTGSELVSFTPSGYWTEAGVRVGRYTFRSFPKPGGADGERFSLFAFPWDVPPDTVPVVYVRNPAGAEITARFWTKVFPEKPHVRDLPIDDAFLEKVVPPLDPDGAGDLLSRFLKINGEMRRANNHTLWELRLKTEEKFLWNGPFVQLANSKVESHFADIRNYIYKGRKVDQQVHLGFDLSVTKNVAVTVANDGKVIWAEPLGIYGNCIVIDHGYGLQSIYGHLSRIGVKPGEMVKKGQTLGFSGSTGLAGGDHLHFAMQVDGVQVNPLEWWDEHWISDHILRSFASPK